MNHLDENRDVIRSLQDLIVVVVAGRKHRRTRRFPARCNGRPMTGPPGRRRDATASLRHGRPLFCASGVNGGILPSGGSTMSEVRLVDTTAVSPVPPDVVVADGEIGLGIAVAAVGIVSFPHLLFDIQPLPPP